MHIREATQNDIRELAEIHVTAWRTAYSGIMPKEVLDNISIEQRTADWQRWLSESGPGMTLVVETSEGVVAFCVFGPSRDKDLTGDNTGEILALNVHPRFWRRGYGKSLCQAVVCEAQRCQWKTMTLWVLRSNERARLFYRALGYSPDGAERFDSDLTGVRLDELRYGKAIE